MNQISFASLIERCKHQNGCCNSQKKLRKWFFKPKWHLGKGSPKACICPEKPFILIHALEDSFQFLNPAICFLGSSYSTVSSNRSTGVGDRGRQRGLLRTSEDRRPPRSHRSSGKGSAGLSRPLPSPAGHGPWKAAPAPGPRLTFQNHWITGWFGQ